MALRETFWIGGVAHQATIVMDGTHATVVLGQWIVPGCIDLHPLVDTITLAHHGRPGLVEDPDGDTFGVVEDGHGARWVEFWTLRADRYWSVALVSLDRYRAAGVPAYVPAPPPVTPRPPTPRPVIRPTVAASVTSAQVGVIAATAGAAATGGRARCQGCGKVLLKFWDARDQDGRRGKRTTCSARCRQRVKRARDRAGQ